MELPSVKVPVIVWVVLAVKVSCLPAVVQEKLLKEALPAIVDVPLPSKTTVEPVTVKKSRFVRLKVAPLKARVRFEISNVVVPVAETDKVPLKSAVSARVSELLAPI